MLFIDVDAVSKLAHWNILPLLTQFTDLPWSSMSSIPSLLHRARRAVKTPDGKLFRCSEAAVLAQETLIRMTEAPEPNVDLVANLGAYPDIDPGEAILLALATTKDDSFLLTGDKRALRRLAATDLAGQFVGRIVVIEQVLMRCLNDLGRDRLLKHVCPYRDIDKAVSICLGSTCDAKTHDIEAGLASYVAEIDGLASPTFLRHF